MRVNGIHTMTRFASEKSGLPSHRYALAALGGTTATVLAAPTEALGINIFPLLPQRPASDTPPVYRPDKPALRSGWASNVRAMTSAGQRWSVPVAPLYMPNLCAALATPQATGLQEAHRLKEQSGCKTEKGAVYFPTSTPTPLLKTFLKSENKTEERFAVLLGQVEPIYEGMTPENRRKAEFFNQAELEDINRLQTHLEQYLNVRPKHPGDERIKRFMAATDANVIEAVIWLMNKRNEVHRKDPNKKVGLLLYYGGHGTCTDYTPHEGGSDGRLVGPRFSEPALKSLVNGLLGTPEKAQKQCAKKQLVSNTLLMFDMCHSGSMVVRHDQPLLPHRPVVTV